MRRFSPFLVAAFLLFAEGAQAAPVRLELPLQKAKLDNGLRVVMNVDKGTHAVAVSIVFDVGSRDEAPGQAGFGRVVEELSFAETKNLGASAFQTLVTSRGGFFTSKTSVGETAFSTVLPENELALGLWLEAERMRHFAPSASALEAAKETITQEILRDPQTRSTTRLRAMVFQDVFAYAHPLYGTKNGTKNGTRDDLDAATIASFLGFHQQHYGPSTAILSLSGDFDPDAAMALVHQYFDAVPANRVSPFVAKSLPIQDGERRDVLTSGTTDSTILSYGFLGPNVKEQGFWALTLAAVILGDGEGARLPALLIHKNKKDALAERANAQMTSIDDRGPSLFQVDITLHASADPKEVETIVDSALERLASKRPTDAEMKRAKTRVEAQFLQGIMSHADRSLALARYELCFGDARNLLRAMEPLDGIHAEDVQKAAAQWLTKNRRSVLETRPKPNASVMAKAAENPQ